MEYYTIPSFTRTNLVKHAFSGRQGGFSQGKYGSLNLSYFTADKSGMVLENRRKFCTELGVDLDSVVCAEQVHGEHIYSVTPTDKGRGAYDRDSAIPATDALITKDKGVALMAFFADCVPIFFLDPVQKVIALVHGGWRGTVAKLAAQTAQTLFAEYGTARQNLLVGIGPSIGPCHYQVDEPVINKVEEAFPAESSILLTERKNSFAQFNLWEANRQQLIAAGVAAENITVAGLCTFCHQERFFSHRGGMLGRQAAVIMLK